MKFANGCGHEGVGAAFKGPCERNKADSRVCTMNSNVSWEIRSEVFVKDLLLLSVAYLLSITWMAFRPCAQWQGGNLDLTVPTRRLQEPRATAHGLLNADTGLVGPVTHLPTVSLRLDGREGARDLPSM